MKASARRGEIKTSSWPRRGTAAALALACGCSHVAELPDGSRRVVGFVSMTVPPAVSPESRGADVLEVTTLGLSLLSAPNAGGVALGYTSGRFVVLRNDALVLLPEKEKEP